MKTSNVFAAALTWGLLAFAPMAQGKSCFIMVHGHNAQDASTPFLNAGANAIPTAAAMSYWSTSNFGSISTSFLKDVTNNYADNYFIVGYRSLNPYYHPDAAGEVTRQIIRAKSGVGDGMSHANQCASNDVFVVVAHSMGGPVMRYIDGNAVAGSPNYNTVYGATAQTANFSGAMAGVASIQTVGGAMRGTEGANRVCNPSLFDAFVNALAGAFGSGFSCDPGTQSLQTGSAWEAASFDYTTHAVWAYNVGGYAMFPGASSATSGLLTGDDDGFINMASQMECNKGPIIYLDYDLKEYDSWYIWSTGYICNNSSKIFNKSKNFVNIDEDHDGQRNSTRAGAGHVTIPTPYSCTGSGSGSAAQTIGKCF